MKFWLTVVNYAVIAVGGTVCLVFLWANGGAVIPNNTAIRFALSCYVVATLITTIPWELVKR